MAHELGSSGPMIVAVNPASFLGSKMVKEAYGRVGHDLRIGADILTRAALWLKRCVDQFKRWRLLPRQNKLSLSLDLALDAIAKRLPIIFDDQSRKERGRLNISLITPSQINGARY